MNNSNKCCCIKIDGINFVLLEKNETRYKIIKIRSEYQDKNNIFYVYRSQSEGLWRLAYEYGTGYYKGDHYVTTTLIDLRLQNFINKNFSKIKSTPKEEDMDIPYLNNEIKKKINERGIENDDFKCFKIYGTGNQIGLFKEINFNLIYREILYFLEESKNSDCIDINEFKQKVKDSNVNNYLIKDESDEIIKNDDIIKKYNDEKDEKDEKNETIKEKIENFHSKKLTQLPELDENQIEIVELMRMIYSKSTVTISQRFKRPIMLYINNIINHIKKNENSNPDEHYLSSLFKGKDSKYIIDKINNIRFFMIELINHYLQTNFTFTNHLQIGTINNYFTNNYKIYRCDLTKNEKKYILYYGKYKLDGEAISNNPLFLDYIKTELEKTGKNMDYYFTIPIIIIPDENNKINELGLYEKYIDAGFFTWKPFDYLGNITREHNNNILTIGVYTYTFIGKYLDKLLEINTQTRGGNKKSKKNKKNNKSKKSRKNNKNKKSKK